MSAALDALYCYDSAQFSPSLASQDINDMLGMPATDSGSPNPENRDSDIPFAPKIPDPPDPSAGGMHGLSRMFGWSTGLRPSRNWRQQFGGQTLVVPSMGVHPVVGSVGFSTFTDRRELGVSSLYDEWLPTQRQVQESFTRPPSNASHME